MSRVLEYWMARHWAVGISVLLSGLAFFRFREDRHRAYSFGKWSLMVLLFSVGGALAMYVLFEVVKLK
jgi:hypothetical protein